MDKEKAELLFIEANRYREYFLDYPNALANLHQIVNAFPDDLKYLYLLASTYLEAQNVDGAQKYADEMLAKEPKSLEALELKGLICEAEKKYEGAEPYYLKCLEIDKNFHNARYDLVRLYSNVFFPKRQYLYPESARTIIFREPIKIIENGAYLLANNTIDPKKSKKKESERVSDFYGLTCRLMSIAFYDLARYEEAIKILEDYISFVKTYTKTFSGFFLNEEINIYKLYYLLEDKEGMKEYEEKIRNAYTLEKDFIKTFERVSEEIKNRIIYL